MKEDVLGRAIHESCYPLNVIFMYGKKYNVRWIDDYFDWDKLMRAVITIRALKCDAFVLVFSTSDK